MSILIHNFFLELIANILFLFLNILPLPILIKILCPFHLIIYKSLPITVKSYA